MGDRKTILLKACLELLERQDNCHMTLDILTETIFYDDTLCDGYCLMTDIRSELYAEG
jgi:hypothetical protein